MPEVRLTLLLGRHALAHHLCARRGASLTATVRVFRYLPGHFPLPHPSPRDAPWRQRHPWFEREVLPAPRADIQRARCIAGRRRYSAALLSLRRCLR